MWLSWQITILCKWAHYYSFIIIGVCICHINYIGNKRKSYKWKNIVMLGLYFYSYLYWSSVSPCRTSGYCLACCHFCLKDSTHYFLQGSSTSDGLLQPLFVRNVSISTAFLKDNFDRYWIVSWQVLLLLHFKNAIPLTSGLHGYLMRNVMY